jgi:fatty acid elongase 2/fatty acid elongase 3
VRPELAESPVADGARAGFVYFASYTYFTSTYFPHMPNAGSCAGEEFAAFAGIGILSSYLLLFISFYLATYRRSGRGNSQAAKKAAKDLTAREVPALGDVANAVSENGAPKAANGQLTANGHAKASGRNTPLTRSRQA